MWVQLSIKHTRAYTTLFPKLIKRCLLLGRKVMINLDSIFKSRDITLLTKVHIAKAMVFLVAMNGYESWTIRKLSAK